MTGFEWLALAIAVALGIYLFYALLRVQDFPPGYTGIGFRDNAVIDSM